MLETTPTTVCQSALLVEIRLLQLLAEVEALAQPGGTRAIMTARAAALGALQEACHAMTDGMPPELLGSFAVGAQAVLLRLEASSCDEVGEAFVEPREVAN